MKTAIIIAALLAIGGTSAILFASELGGTYHRLESLDPLFENDADGRRVAVEVTITAIQSRSKPMEFEGHRLLKADQALGPNERTIRVVYHGDDKIPIERDSSVFVEGRWDAESGVLEATKVSTQCPSRYEGDVKN